MHMAVLLIWVEWDINTFKYFTVKAASNGAAFFMCIFRYLRGEPVGGRAFVAVFIRAFVAVFIRAFVAIVLYFHSTSN